MTPDRLRLHPLEELAGQIEADVGFEEDPADLPEAFLDRIFRQDTASSELLEGVVEFLGQLVEHKPVSITGGRVLDKPPGPEVGPKSITNAVAFWVLFHPCDPRFPAPHGDSSTLEQIELPPTPEAHWLESRATASRASSTRCRCLAVGMS